MKISVLRANEWTDKDGVKHQPTLTKRFTIVSDDELRTDNYDRAKFFTLIEQEVDGIEEFSTLLSALEREPRMCIIRAKVRDGWNHNRVNRRKIDCPKDGPASFLQNPDGVDWVMMDFDKLPVESLELKTNQERLDYLVSLLPPEFHFASYHYQWSSSMGLYGWDMLSCHLFFWLTEPHLDQYWCDRADAEDWSADQAGFRTVQPLYTAAPIFVGCDDILGDERSGFVKRDRDAVKMKPWFKPSPPPVFRNGKFHKRDKITKTFAERLADIGPHYHMPIQKAIASYVATNDQVDEDHLIQIVSDAIRDAPQGASNKSDYLNTTYLRRSIRGAMRKFGS